MTEWLFILVLFLVGVRLSAFFSGIETAFYRASKLRLNIDAQTGDSLSKSILSYVVDPSRFVATILIGNNLANYVTTCAIGYGAILAFGTLSESMEVAVTVCLSPLIFVFGELLPKTLHYRAPLKMLKRYFRFFSLFHVLLLPFSWPLMVLTRILQKVGGDQGTQPMLRILGRSPLATVIGQGREEGIVTPVQHNLIQGVFVTANKSIQSLITPVSAPIRYQGEVSLSELQSYVQSKHLVGVVVEKEDEEGQQKDWQYYYLADLLLWNGPIHEIAQVVPQLPHETSWLEALLMLHENGADIAAVYDKENCIGFIARDVLSKSLSQDGYALAQTLF